MEKIFGKSICEGIAIGKIKYLATEDSSVAKTHTEDTEHEVNRYETAKKDLALLESDNKLKRVYGGAISLSSNND